MFKKNKDILNIALPAMGENFLQMLMGMVDSYLVAHLGLIAISGVSVAGNIITIYQAIFIALGAAISSVISKSLGQKDQSRLAYHVTEALKITLLLSLVLGVLSIFAGREMIGLLGTEASVAESGGLYLALVGGTIVLLGLMTSLGALIRATHNPRLPLYVSFLSNALNILFSSVAIFILDMGIAGRGCDFVVAIKTSIYKTKFWTGQRLADLGFTCSGRTSHDASWRCGHYCLDCFFRN